MRDHRDRRLPTTDPLAVEPDWIVPEVALPVAPGERVFSTRQLAWRRFKRHKLAIGSLGILVVMALAAALGPVFSSYSYRVLDLNAAVQGPSARHLFGTDGLGRDMFTRVLYGGRISLVVGLSVALISGVIGTVIGALAAFYGRWLDNLLMRVTDLFLSIPSLVILILAAKALGGSVFDIILILSLFFWMGGARVVRGVFLSLKEREYVESARAAGASNARIMFVHMLPNAMGPIVVNTTLDVAEAIIAESALSFLGFGIKLPTPTWGNLLNDAQNFTLVAPWLVVFPGLMILITVLCVNFLGDGLRDALDPHQKLGSAI